MTTMKHTTIMSVFAEEAQAQQAMNDLQYAGIRPQQIWYSVHRGGTGITDSLEQLGLPEQEADFYNREFEAGHTVVMVNTPDRQQDVYDVLSHYGGYNFNSRACIGYLGHPFEKEAPWAFITLRLLMVRGTQPSIEEGNCSRPKEKTRR
jgi:hypothetical protein